MELTLLILFCVVYLGPPLIGVITAIVVHRWCAKRNYKLAGTIVSIVALLLAGSSLYNTYQAFYPRNDFYEADFEFETKRKFPASGNIMAKEASFPDFQGQYNSTALIQFSDSDYRLLLHEIDMDHSFDTDKLIGNNSSHFDKVIRGYNKNSIVRIAKKDKMHIGFFDDHRTIVVERAPYIFP